MKSTIELIDEKGFSLIELLISMGLFLIGSLAVAALFYSTSNSIRSSNEMTEAIFIAEDHLNQTLALRYRNLGTGTCTDCMAVKSVTDGKYNVSVGINPLPAALTAGSTATITVTVTWGNLLSSSTKSYTIQCIRAETRNTGV